MADLIQTFRRLNAHQRRQVLALLPAELTPYEWRHLHAITSSRSFHTDIIGRLPLELVAHVFSYLDPTAPYRCQSVCRRWSHVLRSLDVLKAVLDSWYQGARPPLQGANYASCVQMASKIHRFRTGRPACIYKIVTHAGPGIKALGLFGDHLTWMPGPDLGSPPRFACMLNLQTWQLRHLAGEAREALVAMIASDQIVMLSTATNTCYVYQVHHERPPKKFRLPSTKFLKYLHCNGRTIACVAWYETHTSVFIWDYDTQRGTSFDISHGPDSIFADHSPRQILHIAPLVQPETETISLLFVAETLIVMAMYTYRGELISSFCPRLPHVDQITFSSGGSRWVPADDSNTVFTVRLMVQGSISTPIPNIVGTLPLEFNVTTRNLSMPKGLKLHGHIPQVCFAHSPAWWKDICYGFRLDTELAKDMITYMGTRDTKAHAPVFSESNRIYPSRHLWNPDPLLLNDRYVIRVLLGTFYIACFDNDSNRPTADESFFDMGRVFL